MNIIIDIVDTINIIAIYKYLSSLEYSIFIKALNINAYFGGFLEVYSCTGDSSSKGEYSFKEDYSILFVSK